MSGIRFQALLSVAENVRPRIEFIVPSSDPGSTELTGGLRSRTLINPPTTSIPRMPTTRHQRKERSYPIHALYRSVPDSFQCWAISDPLCRNVASSDPQSGVTSALPKVVRQIYTFSAGLAYGCVRPVRVEIEIGPVRFPFLPGAAIVAIAICFPTASDRVYDSYYRPLWFTALVVDPDVV